MTASLTEDETARRARVEALRREGAVRELKELVLAFVPEHHAARAAAAVQALRRADREGRGQSAKPLLLLSCRGDSLPWTEGSANLGCIGGAELYIPAGALPAHKLAILDQDWNSAGVAPPEGFAYCLRSGPLKDAAAVARALEPVFGLFPHYARPLRHYACTFHFTLYPPRGQDGRTLDPLPALRYRYPTYSPADLPEDSLARYQADAQAYRFFSPAIRDQLYEREEADVGLIPVREWRLDGVRIADWQLHVGADADRADPLLYQVARITELTLYEYFNGVRILTCTVQPEALAELQRAGAGAPGGYLFRDESDWWLALVLAPPDQWCQIQALQLEAWLRFTRLARLLYPSFVEQFDEQKIAQVRLVRPNKQTVEEFTASRAHLVIPKAVGQDISGVWRALTAAFFEQRDQPALQRWFEHNQQVDDDRLFVNVAYGLAGPPLDPERLTQAYSLALFGDTPSDTFGDCGGFAYSKAEVERQLEARSFRLWDDLGQRSGYTDCTNVHLGFSNFFCNIVARVHVPRIYGRMLLQALFYRASLRHYERRITDVTAKLVAEADPDAIRELRKEFITFTNQYWFHDLSPTMQGKAIFRLQQEALELQREYQLIKEEMERTDELIQSEYQRRMQQIADKVSLAGLAFALVALWYTLLPLLLDDRGAFKSRLLRWGAERVLMWSPPLAAWLAEWKIDLLVGGLPILVGGVVICFWWRMARKRRGIRSGNAPSDAGPGEHDPGSVRTLGR